MKSTFFPTTHKYIKSNKHDSLSMLYLQSLYSFSEIIRTDPGRKGMTNS